MILLDAENHMRRARRWRDLRDLAWMFDKDKAEARAIGMAYGHQFRAREIYYDDRQRRRRVQPLDRAQHGINSNK